MSEETQKPPESPASPPPKRPTRSPRSVFQYIAILFAAAFVLLLFTLLVEKRQNERLQQVNQDQLQQNNSAVQTLQGLMEENERLKTQVAQLEASLEEEAAARTQLETRWNELAQAKDSLEETSQWALKAMDLFWQIDEAYVRGRYTLCRELIEQMESPETEPAAGILRLYLPEENLSGTGRPSPTQRYQEIVEQVT